MQKKHIETLASPHIRCWNLVPCKSEIQLKSYRVIVMKCCPPASRNFISDSWFDSWVGQRRQNQQAASTNRFKVYNASIKNTTSSQWHPRSSFVAKCLSSVHDVCKLDGSTSLGHFRRGSVLPRGVCHHVIVVFFFVFCFLFWSSHIPPFGLWQSVANGTLTKTIDYPPSRGLTWICTMGQVPLCYSS